MKLRKVLIGSIVVALFAVAGGLAWRWYATPVPPVVPLDGVDKTMAARVEKALQEVRDAPRSGEAWGTLSMVLIANGFDEQAIPCLVHAEHLDPEESRWAYWHGHLRLSSRPLVGVHKLRKALILASLPEQRAAILFILARVLVEDGQFEEAKECLQALNEIEPGSPRLHFGLGVLALAQGNRAKAREHLQTLLENPFARKRASTLLATLTDGNDNPALSHQQKAGQIGEDLPWPNPYADEIHQYSVDQTPSMAPYHALQAQGRQAEAVDYLRQLAAESPDEEVCLTLGAALLMRNEFEEAEKALRQALAINLRNVKAHLVLGSALLRRGEALNRSPDGKAQAQELFRKAVVAEEDALSLQCDNTQAHLLRGQALKHLGCVDEALKAFREAVLVGPEFAEMHQALGEALAEAGQRREALQHLEDAVRLAQPGEMGPLQALQKWRDKGGTLPPSGKGGRR